MPLCNQIVKAARNGIDRGACTRSRGHRGRHASRSCPICGSQTAAPYCDDCRSAYAENYRKDEAVLIAKLEELIPIVMERLASLPANIVQPVKELAVGDMVVVKIPILEEVCA
jgi:hypothetical protein